MTISELKRVERQRQKAIAANPRAWWLQNPERLPSFPRKERRVAPVNYRRQAIKEGNAQMTDEEKRIVGHLYLAAARISECTTIPFHVDHIVPLARGGSHLPHNLRLLTAALNFSKGARQKDV